MVEVEMGGRVKLSKQQREEIRLMFGGKCAYCSQELTATWQADHFEPLKRIGRWVKIPDTDETPAEKRTPWGYSFEFQQTGFCQNPDNDTRHNLVPACRKCNILKSGQTVEEFRTMFAYFAASIPTIRTYSHVHHLMRFGKVTIDPTPVVFWYETYRAEQLALQSNQGD